MAQVGWNPCPERARHTHESSVRLPINRKKEGSSQELAGFALGAVGVAYVLAFVPLHAALGGKVFTLSTVLVCGAGYLWGARAGLSAGALSLPLHLLLLSAAGEDGWSSAMGKESLTSTLVSVAVGGMVGLLRGSYDRLEIQARELEHQALHDPLTGLANRALFFDRLRHALARAARRKGTVAVVFVDLDDFKDVNDRLGHGVGDELLVAVAERLKGCLRPEDALARMGGDEFAAVLEDVASASGATVAAERISEGLKPPFVLAGSEAFVTASIGVALADAGEVGVEDLLADADAAMYRAKAKGEAGHEVSMRSARRAPPPPLPLGRRREPWERASE